MTDNIDPTEELQSQWAIAQDRLDSIRAQIAKDGLTVAGSKGQIRAHPLLAECRQLEVAVSRMLQVLGQPKSPGKTQAARDLARERWAQG